MTCLIVPGLHSSDPGHWQSRWEAERGDCSRVELGEWEDPTLILWMAGLGRAVLRAGGFPVLVAHGLGCLAVAWWASIAGEAAAKITGALLVAPPDAEQDGAEARLQRFASVPRRPMPFPTIVVASRDDPHAGYQRSREMAAGWSARLHDAGEAGHINAASGLGSWPEGQRLVAELEAGAASRWQRPLARRAGGRR